MSKIFEWVIYITIIGVICAFIAMPIYFMERKIKNRVYPDPIFTDGQIVKMKLSGNRGMVVSHYCSHVNKTCTYSVRFSSLQMNTNVSLFGSDGPIDVAPVALVRGIKEFELINERERE